MCMYVLISAQVLRKSSVLLVDTTMDYCAGQCASDCYEAAQTDAVQVDAGQRICELDAFALAQIQVAMTERALHSDAIGADVEQTIMIEKLDMEAAHSNVAEAAAGLTICDENLATHVQTVASVDEAVDVKGAEPAALQSKRSLFSATALALWKSLRYVPSEVFETLPPLESYEILCLRKCIFWCCVASFV